MYAVIALAVVVAAQALVLVRVSQALHTVGRFGERLAHLTAALELLTDTTESGLLSVSAELSRSATERRPARSSRGATSRRISTAAQRGHSIEEIAARESLSHGEVRLHLQLAPTEKGTGHGPLRG
jgi:hypothetical protein